MAGPLEGIKVVEMTGLGPCPLAGQMLADMGADVIVIDRKFAPADPSDINRRGKRSVVLDLKSFGGVRAAKTLIEQADVLIEGFRPGVMEKLGLGPDQCPDHLVYGRMTGWGQDGPLSHTAGHDINYLSLSGALNAMGSKDQPPEPPLNLVADYGGGTMFLLVGVLAALLERHSSGRGQVVDAAMVDGVPAMMGLIHQFRHTGFWSNARQSNWLDGGAPFYRCYECADGRFISVGALEPQFFAEFVKLAGLPEAHCADQNDRRTWVTRRAQYAAHFKTRTRDEWAALFDGSDACVAAVLEWDEIENHPHNAARDIFQRVGDVIHPSPAPRFSRTPAKRPSKPRGAGEDSAEVLRELGLSADQITSMIS